MTASPIFGETHHLELLAAQALARGEAALAFELADRRCRVGRPEAHVFLLRAEASYRMGERRSSIADLAAAIELAPNDIPSNRKLLDWSRGRQQEEAALALLSADQDFAVLARAIAVLWGRRERRFARVTVLDEVIQGWAAWDSDLPVEITISGEGSLLTTAIEPDPRHPLARRQVRAAGFRLLRPAASGPQFISLSLGGEIFFASQRPGNQPKAPSPSDERRVPDAEVTVIVPVYRDYRATAACLESLAGALEGNADHQILVIDDATPDPRIARLLSRLAADATVILERNSRNLGFVGSVNKALAMVGRGDVVLLNSDTVTPPGSVRRLSLAARSMPGVGTVTPLSNHGELTSFPAFGKANPALSIEEVVRLDRIASEVNQGRMIDLPSGTGFCLYITRPCLDAVGQLSEAFGRGYFEDVDLCLRARQNGFRTVCAPFVYVGHAGSRSFGREKSALVAQNFRILDQRFPRYLRECAAFAIADPLRPARAAIERRSIDHGANPRLLVTGIGALWKDSLHSIQAGRDEIACDRRPWSWDETSCPHDERPM